MKKHKADILLVEDDQNLGFILQDYLQMEGYHVTLKKDGQAGLESFRTDSFDLCIFDVMMPIKDGFDLARDIKGIKPEVPFIFLTAKGMEQDRITGLKIGAEDYITKPFSTEELKLRLDIILRRVNTPSNKRGDEIYPIGDYSFDYNNQILKHEKEEKRLTKKEALVLRLLSVNINQLVRREIALKTIWGADDYFMGRSMDVYIAKLRSYLKNDERVNIINVHGTGFKLEFTNS
jgi:DNA-binding response OmpR family regulator